MFCSDTGRVVAGVEHHLAGGDWLAGGEYVGSSVSNLFAYLLRGARGESSVAVHLNGAAPLEAVPECGFVENALDSAECVEIS